VIHRGGDPIKPQLSRRFSPWPAALIGIIVIKAVLSLGLKPGSFLFSYSGVSYLLLLVLASSFAIRNAIQNTLGSRLFWAFLAIGYGLWSLDQWIYLYYELGLHTEVPDASIADPVLFLHIVPFMAALAVFPHRNQSEQLSYRAVLDALLLLFFWTFLYGYEVFPYQYLAHSTNYGLRFDILYGLESFSLVLAAGILTLRARVPWQSIYFHLFGAFGLYALGSVAANLAIDSGGYVNGKLYGLALTASVCWFVWIPLRARQLSRPVRDVVQDSSQSRASSWAMLVVVLIFIPIAWELYHRDETASTRTFRLLVASLAIVCMACAAYIREHLVRSELASRLVFTSHRLRLAMKSGKTVAWDWDVKSGRDSWFGDLQSQFGIPSDTHVGRVEDFHRRIHAEDRERVAKAVKDAMKNRTPYSAEFRIPQPDGTVRWVSAEGEFIYAVNGEPERMLGISVDITQRKWAEDALSHVNRKLIEAQELERTRIARELHDDFGQRLALLAVQLEQLENNPADSVFEVQTRVGELRKQVMEISMDIQALSHELHSSKLEYLGVVAAMKSFCKEFGEQQRMEIGFRSHDVPSSLLPKEVSLSLFRVLQEALRNAAKHSGVHLVEVHLWGTTDEIHLTVSDTGAGFDPKTAKDGRGLGLISMQERMKLVNGDFFIESRPMLGTTIRTRVPLSTDMNSKRAAG
jgi:signal transduction histidine kinase